jgi:hypothetical protein
MKYATDPTIKMQRTAKAAADFQRSTGDNEETPYHHLCNTN